MNNHNFRKVMMRITLLGLFLVAATAFGADMELGRAAIVVPDKPKSVEHAAAGELQYHLEKATGRKFEIMTSRQAANSGITGGFRLGSAVPEKLRSELAGGEPNSFVIRTADGFVNIAGRDGTRAETEPRTGSGTLFGVYRYLNRALDVRWLWPGSDGEVIPRRDKLPLDGRADGFNRPAFKFVRSLKLPKTPDGRRWARRVMNLTDAGYPVIHGKGHTFTNWAEK